MGNVIFTNNYGHEFILTEEEAERQIEQGKISFKQIRQIEENKEKKALKPKQIKQEEQEVDSEVETQEVDLNKLTLEELQAEYLEVFGKELAPAYKNNAEWIKNKLITK